MKERLFSLDMLRGLDMLLLVAAGPLFRQANAAWNFASPAVMGQFKHGWECFTLWDIIMPLFIFMCGAAIPFALERRLKEGKAVFWKHVLGRVALLWFLGMLVQGHLAEFNPLTFNPFSNTLESIAVGYLVTAAVMCVPSRKFQIAVPVVLAALYTALLAVGGDYSEFGNAAYKVDRAIHELIFPAKHERLVTPSHYTWYLTSLMFAVMTLCGYHATQLLRAAWERRTKALALFGYAAALLALGFGVSPWIPVIKPIFTLSFTALAMGWSVLALAILYVLNDILMIRRGAWPVLLFGQVALCAYFVSHFFRPVLSAFAKTVAQGVLPHVAKDTQPFLLECFVVLGLVLVMVFWRQWKARRT